MIEFEDGVKHFLDDWAYGLAFCGGDCKNCILGIFKGNQKCSRNAQELLKAIEEYNGKGASNA